MSECSRGRDVPQPALPAHCPVCPHRGANTTRATARARRTACARPCPPTPAPAPSRASCCGAGGSASAVSARCPGLGPAFRSLLSQVAAHRGRRGSRVQGGDVAPSFLGQEAAGNQRWATLLAGRGLELWPRYVSPEGEVHGAGAPVWPGWSRSDCPRWPLGWVGVLARGGARGWLSGKGVGGRPPAPQAGPSALQTRTWTPAPGRKSSCTT